MLVLGIDKCTYVLKKIHSACIPEDLSVNK